MGCGIPTLLPRQHVESSWTGNQTMFPAMQAGFLTTGPPRKSDAVFLKTEKGLWQPCTEQVYWCHFSMEFAHSVSLFGEGNATHSNILA